MQINGVGSGHGTGMHQVTECLHDHSTALKDGGTKMASAESKKGVSQNVFADRQQEGSFSLVSWLRDTFSNGSKLLHMFWGNGGESNLQTEEQVMAQVGDPDEGLNAALAGQNTMADMTVRQQALPNNPYFSAIGDTGREKQTAWEKVRVKFQSIAGQLTKRFSGRNTFQAKQEGQREDLRKHSRYREDDLEIECILTDDSYLMDSYDRKGKYSKLSTKQ